MFSTKEILQKPLIAIDSKAKVNEIKAIAIDEAKAVKNLLSVEDKARMLMNTLRADDRYLAFYCKCYHQLPEGTLQYILEGARKAKYPDRYFAKAAKAEMYKLSYGNQV